MADEPMPFQALLLPGELTPPHAVPGRGIPTWNLSDDQGQGFRLLVANDRGTRERAYALASRVYALRDYVGKDTALCCSAFDAQPDAFTALIETDDGRDVGTISLFFDGAAGMPCDEIYRDRLAGLRAAGRRLVEVGRFAIDDAFARSRQLRVALFDCISIHARRVARFDDLVIEVNPRHVSFYERTLGFVAIGEERPCPRVQGAPAVLLRLDLEEQIRLIGSVDDPAARAASRLLYALFLRLEDEAPIAEYLAREHAPMSRADARHFALAPSPAARSGRWRPLRPLRTERA